MEKNYDFSTKTLTGGKNGIKFLFFHLENLQTMKSMD